MQSGIMIYNEKWGKTNKGLEFFFFYFFVRGFVSLLEKCLHISCPCSSTVPQINICIACWLDVESLLLDLTSLWVLVPTTKM